MHMLRHPQSEAGVPPGAVKRQHNLLVGASTHLTCELGQFDFKHGNADGGRQMGQMKERPTGGGMDEAHQVAQMTPGEAVLHGDDGRWPIGVQTRRRSGFKPMRCSSVAQTSTWAWA